MALAPDTRIHDYRIIRLLGEGGMGEVYLAEDVKLGREVAVKVLPPAFVSDPARRKRFEHEARAASKLNHPNSAFVYGFGEWDGGAYLAIEYVEGETLHSRLQHGALSCDELVRVGAQIADVLHAAHEKGITHRDIKPQNIMLTRQGVVKLLDFGLAKFDAMAAGASAGASVDTMSILTEAGTVVGSIGYMSPEHALGKPVDARSDVFALGIVLYQMATARRPFAGANAAEVLSKILTSAPEPLARWNYDIPSEIDRIVRKCLEKSPDDRYQSAREVAIDLRAWKRDSQTPLRVVQPVRPTIVTRRRAIVAVSAVSAAAAGVAAYRWFAPRVPGSLAVLPFSNQGGPENDALCDGLTEALINEIAGTGELRVIARSAVFRFTNVTDPLAIGRKLNVAVLIAGRLKPGTDTLGVSAELVDVATAQQLWNQQTATTLSGLQTLAGDLAHQVMRALGVKRRSVQPPRRVADPDAYQNYLKGRYALNRRVPDAFAKAADLFRKAIEIDPSYAPPYAGLADVYSFQSGALPPSDVCPKAKAAALKAIELDGALSEAYAALGFVQLHYDFAWSEAESTLKHAIHLNPSYPLARGYYARLLTARKRFREAEAEEQKAIALDPFSPALATGLGNTYYLERKFATAETQLNKVLADQPKFVQARSYLGLVHIAQKNYRAAIDDLESCLKIFAVDDTGLLADLALSYALSGEPAKARELVQRIERIAARQYVPPYVFAAPLIGLGEKQRALDMLEKAVDPDRSWPVIYYAVEPKLDPVRGEPRFQQLLRRINLNY